MTERQEIVVRRGGGPGCIGIFLIIGFIALGIEQIGKHPGVATGIALAIAVAVGLFLWYREQRAAENLAAAPSPTPTDGNPVGAKQIATDLPPPPLESAAPKAPQVPQGWYADPMGQASWRWWDGGNWTDRTS